MIYVTPPSVIAQPTAGKTRQAAHRGILAAAHHPRTQHAMTGLRGATRVTRQARSHNRQFHAEPKKVAEPVPAFVNQCGRPGRTGSHACPPAPAQCAPQDHAKTPGSGRRARRTCHRCSCGYATEPAAPGRSAARRCGIPGAADDARSARHQGRAMMIFLPS